MVSAFFNKANVAAAFGVMAFMISYLPYIIYTQFREDYKQVHLHASVSQCLVMFCQNLIFFHKEHSFVCK